MSAVKLKSKPSSFPIVVKLLRAASLASGEELYFLAKNSLRFSPFNDKSGASSKGCQVILISKSCSLLALSIAC